MLGSGLLPGCSSWPPRLLRRSKAAATGGCSRPTSRSRRATSRQVGRRRGGFALSLEPSRPGQVVWDTKMVGCRVPPHRSGLHRRSRRSHRSSRPGSGPRAGCVCDFLTGNFPLKARVDVDKVDQVLTTNMSLGILFDNTHSDVPAGASCNCVRYLCRVLSVHSRMT